MEKTIDKKEFWEISKTDELLIIDFFAEWCGACNLLANEFEKFQKNNPKIKFAKVDIDKESELALDLNIQGVPTVAAFKNGKEVKRVSGYQTESALESFLTEVK